MNLIIEFTSSPTTVCCHGYAFVRSFFSPFFPYLCGYAFGLSFDAYCSTLPSGNLSLSISALGVASGKARIYCRYALHLRTKEKKSREETLFETHYQIDVNIMYVVALLYRLKYVKHNVFFFFFLWLRLIYIGPVHMRGNYFATDKDKLRYFQSIGVCITLMARNRIGSDRYLFGVKYFSYSLTFFFVGFLNRLTL